MRRIISEVEQQAASNRQKASITTGTAMYEFFISFRILLAKKQWTRNVTAAVTATESPSAGGMRSMFSGLSKPEMTDCQDVTIISTVCDKSRPQTTKTRNLVHA